MSSPSGPSAPDEKQVLFWSIPPADLLAQLKTTAEGLTQAEAQSRLAGGAGLRKPNPLWKMPSGRCRNDRPFRISVQ